LRWRPRRNRPMVLTRLHISATILIAMMLHGVFAAWLSLPEQVALPKPVKQAIKVNLLAAIAETTVNTASEKVKTPTPQKVKPKPITKKQPKKVKPKPVIKKQPKKPQPIKPSVAEVKPVKQLPEQRVESTQPSQTEVSVTKLDAVATARYEQLLVAWLEKHKKYPSRAKRLRIEGEGMLRILIDRNGQTQQVSLQQRTGNRLLDKAVLEMAQRANPFPPMPKNDPRLKLEFVVPVAFLLR